MSMKIRLTVIFAVVIAVIGLMSLVMTTKMDLMQTGYLFGLLARLPMVASTLIAKSSESHPLPMESSLGWVVFT